MSLENRSIFIMAGIELMAYQHKDGEWHLKVGHCNQCGKCCQNMKNHPFPLIDGRCIHLRLDAGGKTYSCQLKANRPFGCSVGTVSENRIPECTEKFEVVDESRVLQMLKGIRSQ